MVTLHIFRSMLLSPSSGYDASSRMLLSVRMETPVLPEILEPPYQAAWYHILKDHIVMQFVVL